MGEIVLKCLATILLTAFSSFLAYLGNVGWAVLTEIAGLAIIFDAVEQITDFFDW